MELRIENLRTDYVYLCADVLSHGELAGPRGIQTRELTGVTLVLEDPTAVTLPIGVNRKVNTKLAAVEALGFIGGVWPHDLVLAAAPEYVNVLVDPSRIHTTNVAYGPRTGTQVPTLVQLLRDDPASRQAVLNIWRHHDLFAKGDKPCTLNLQFLIRQNALQCITSMRSQDVWFGLAMDIFQFTQLQLTLARMLGVLPGKFVHHVGSLHAYERDWDKISQLEPTLSAYGEPFPAGLEHPQQARDILAGIAPRALEPGIAWYVQKINALREVV